MVTGKTPLLVSILHEIKTSRHKKVDAAVMLLTGMLVGNNS